ncbi:MAG: hypothetical protein IH987_07095, partial [Planctomycetes bacterium]|nr:hypothetical protein [Planctomycetota bacterium]
IWDLKTGGEIRRWELDGEIHAVSFSPDGRFLASGSAKKFFLSAQDEKQKVNIWDVGTGIEVGSLSGPMTEINSLAFSPDGTQLAAGVGSYKGGGGILIWEVRSGQLTQELSGLKKGIASLAFSPNGLFLASGGFDRRIRHARNLGKINGGRIRHSKTRIAKRPSVSHEKKQERKDNARHHDRPVTPPGPGGVFLSLPAMPQGHEGYQSGQYPCPIHNFCLSLDKALLADVSISFIDPLMDRTLRRLRRLRLESVIRLIRNKWGCFTTLSSQCSHNKEHHRRHHQAGNHRDVSFDPLVAEVPCHESNRGTNPKERYGH